jgi:hypothetical protein
MKKYSSHRQVVVMNFLRRLALFHSTIENTGVQSPNLCVAR